MAVFENCTVVLDVKNLPFKEKNKLRSALLDNAGNISYVVNKECSFVVTSCLDDLSSNRQRSIQKHNIPLVGLQYVWSCLEKGHLLPLTEHILAYPSFEPLPYPEIKVLTQPSGKLKGQPQLRNTETEILEKDGPHLGKFRVYKESDRDMPEFPSHFQVAKYSVFESVKPKTLSVLELQSAKGGAGQQYRVLCSMLRESEKVVVQDKLVYCVTSEDAVDAYQMLMMEMETQGFTQTHTLPPEAEQMASYSLKQLLLEEKLNCSTLSQEVGIFVELVWTEALGSLGNILTVPVSSISLNDVSRVEGLLLQAQKTQKEAEVKALLEEVNTLLPLRMIDPPSKHKLVSQKLDLCQLIRDIVNVSEATLRSPSPSSLGKYRALRCSIEVVPPQNPEFHVVSQLLQDRTVQIQQILRVNRGVELQMFREEIGNIKPLLHSTSPRSFVGILSRGLLLPKVGVEQHGIERTDIGNLGGGIYFSDSLMTSVKYSKPSVTDGSRLLLVCEVALGQCKDLLKRDTTLTSAPEDYNSVHGVRRTPEKPSEFEDDEYVVYNTDQIKLKYVVQYTLEEDQLKMFQPHIDTSVELTLPIDTTSDILSSDDSEGLEFTKNPLEEMTAGLLDSNGQKLPLQAVHVRCKLMDLLCQVIIFQTYTNQSAVPIEAKYVFPLEETAAVCGFEAFINGKHIIGKVKEKEQARKEYKQAIEKGHGAYLMDQDAPDVFTISVGNLPPGATVLIKLTFITELVVRAGSIIFSLPGSVAPWQQSDALNQRTQGTVEKVCVTEFQSEGEFSLCMSIEMPYEIIDLRSSHRIKSKMTDCKAVVSTLPGQTLGSEGLQVSFSLSKIHMPRMWVENHPEKDSQACMLVFYPDFKSSGVSSSGDSSSVSDVVILLDSSESMRGDAIMNARRIALQVLNSLERSLKINIISFGTDYKEAFPAPVPLDEASESARQFIMFSSGAGGSTELWRPLRSLSLLPPSQGVRNILLLSDGHVQNQAVTLQLIRENSCHTRLFTCGLSLTANRHMLRALAQAGGGTYEFFDTKMKHTWTEKVRAQVQRMESPGCRSVAVKWQQFNPTAPPPVQAPSQLHALFSDCHTMVYGFVPHCTQATLFGDLSGQEIKTMVSTTELQKTKGTFLHKLTARAIIRDYEDGILGNSEAEHEGKKAELKSYITELSKEFSILSQFTSFVAIEERDQNQLDTGFTDIPKLIAEEDVDILSYMGWTEEKQTAGDNEEELKLVEIISGTSCDYEDAPYDFFDDILDGDGEGYLSLSDYEGSMSSYFKSKTELKSSKTHTGFSSDVVYGQCYNNIFEEILPSPPSPVFNIHKFKQSKIDGLHTMNAAYPSLRAQRCDSVHHPNLSTKLVAGSPSEYYSSVPFPMDLSITAYSPSAPPLGAKMQIPCTTTAILSSRYEHESVPVPPPATKPDTSVPPSPPVIIAGSPPENWRPKPKPLSTTYKPFLHLCDDMMLEPSLKSVKPPSPLASMLPPPPAPFLSLPVKPIIPGLPSYGQYGSPTDALQKSVEPEQFCGSSVSNLRSSFMFGASVQHQQQGFGISASTQVGSSVPMPPPAIKHQAPPPALATGAMMSLPCSRSDRPPSPPACMPSSAPASYFSYPVKPIIPELTSFAYGSPRTHDALQNAAEPEKNCGSSAPQFRPSVKFGASVQQQQGGFAYFASPQQQQQLFGMSASNQAGGTVPMPHSAIKDQAPPPAPPSSAIMPIVWSMSGRPPSPPASMPPPPASFFSWAAKPKIPELPSFTNGNPSGALLNIAEPEKDCGFSDPQFRPSFKFGASVKQQQRGFEFFASHAAKSVPMPPPAIKHKAPSPAHPPGAMMPLTCSMSVRPPSASMLSPPRLQVFSTPIIPQQQQQMRELQQQQQQSFFALAKNSTFSWLSVQNEPNKITALNLACAPRRPPDTVAWDELFELQHEDGYWECTGRLSSFLSLDVDFFANVFLKEKGICSLGVKAHVDILRLVATLLVLQLIRVKKLAEGELLLSLFKLKESQGSRPVHWEAVKRAVDWACWADRQYPCVCSRLEFGWDWDSSTRQLLGCDSPLPFSPIIPVLERRVDVSVM
ncbi:protein mono-ADP-ribosyltransferase PARP4-like isoform X9 [Myxocyprinus asiaticus]|uniref:protein mono-ADP-ribosyltransferase PARP4-like isoform X8 n=1 Tax=Myxocyprinus asiaticus TaxID=70543 RepID=UPI0022226F88|nr:protein mono-ADP-ribosyltransferase PARP4-like isoform X8 [Myxocyprinus asiaticus]XP_051565948.1 protein mono-ADP-ribosyltransferase PARP4-like isoform X9 [Myxocyprinus asiaticus]